MSEPVQMRSTPASSDAAFPRDDLAQCPDFIACLATLAVMLLVLLRQGLGEWSCLPVALGVLGAWQRWRLGPFLTLLALVILLVWREDVRLYYLRLQRSFRLNDWLLCMAVLGYFAAQYRLQSLGQSIFPLDPHRSRQPVAGALSETAEKSRDLRRTRADATIESSWMLLGLPVCALFAQVFWRLLPAAPGRLSLATRVWQGMVAGWCLFIVVFVTHSVLRYLGWKRQSPQEAGLFMQDTLWQETRREQRRINYWLAWARLRRKKEPQ